MVLEILRYTVFAALVGATIVATGSWLLRTRRISPFSTLGRTMRSLTEPALKPVERMLVRHGGNPQLAGWWLLVITVIVGILVISAAGWLAAQLAGIRSAPMTGRTGLRMIVYYAFQVVIFAIIVRVISSWFGAGRYNRWIRPFYLVTDWIIEPLRKVIPPFGAIDITPIVAWFLLTILLRLVMGVL